MGLKDGAMTVKGYVGTAVCDCCGFAEFVSAVQDKFSVAPGAVAAKLERPWRYVPFEYRNWAACGKRCEEQLGVVRDREMKRSRDAAVREKVKMSSQRRPFPIVGTTETAEPEAPEPEPAEAVAA